MRNKWQTQAQLSLWNTESFLAFDLSGPHVQLTAKSRAVGLWQAQLQGRQGGGSAVAGGAAGMCLSRLTTLKTSFV